MPSWPVRIVLTVMPENVQCAQYVEVMLTLVDP